MSASLNDSAKNNMKNVIHSFINRLNELYFKSIYGNNTSINFHDDLRATIEDVRLNIDLYSNFLSEVHLIKNISDTPLMSLPQGRLLQFPFNNAIYRITDQYGTGCAAGCAFHSLLNMFASLNVFRESIVNTIPYIGELLNKISTGSMKLYNEALLVRALGQSFAELLHGELCTASNDVMDTLSVLANIFTPNINSEIIQFHLRTKDLVFKEIDYDNRKIIHNTFRLNINYSDVLSCLNRHIRNDLVETEVVQMKPAIIDKYTIDLFKLMHDQTSNDEIEKSKKELIVFNIYYKKPLYVIFDIATIISYFNTNVNALLTFNIQDVKYRLVSIVEHRGMHYVNIFIKDGKGIVYDDLSMDVYEISIDKINWTEVSVFCFMRSDGEWSDAKIPINLTQLKERIMQEKLYDEHKFPNSDEEEDISEIDINEALDDPMCCDYEIDYENVSDNTDFDESSTSEEEEEDIDDSDAYVPYNADCEEIDANEYISECSDCEEEEYSASISSEYEEEED